ncbi:MAG: N-acetylglucosamine-6-phosphate deacetylase [Propionicimonas sp.]|uniref:N-acetylglucosamine-6-phosphate deacetylase n=1 Tax=Propionicimonas sp. TaxID=1955623 RepID=UPI002B1ECC84|nr:N-acetylglucosamine-6-phosphate deacetylase [Propionicimonas sp.]MEA4943764.1 N-acetylglucosamine-6-phosphate deacetylase [Propionicimonas sp.]MEA5117133.1 N-acetylglucosamine-6-phosphate deacetylase [Propionicimonas sp.]
MLLSAERILLDDADEFTPGWVELAGDRIVAVGVGVPSSTPDERLDGTVVPGYVDVHSHGGGGATFTEGAEAAHTVLAVHRATGTTTMVASLVTGTIPDLHAQVAALVPLVEAGDLAGIHLEGPWLAEKYKGAHPPELLTDPDPAEVAALLETGRGAVRMATIAPERTGGLESIRLMTARGCLAAIGHTDADYQTACAAVEAGARGATHLFNAMPPLLHRAPGPVLSLWHDPRVTVELVADGVHVTLDLIAWVMATAPGRVALITDAMGAAAAPDGDYMLGELAVVVRDRVARLVSNGAIAGSTLTLDRAVRNVVAAGVPLVQAVRSATSVPSDYLGLPEVGRLAAGKRADLLVLDDDLAVARVLWRGAWQS